MSALAARSIAEIAQKPGSSSNAPDPASMSQRQTAQYVADMVLELRKMSKAHNLSTVLPPLEYAYYEAFTLANQVSVPQDELDHIRQLEQAARDQEKAVPHDY